MYLARSTSLPSMSLTWKSSTDVGFLASSGRRRPRRRSGAAGPPNQGGEAAEGATDRTRWSSLCVGQWGREDTACRAGVELDRCTSERSYGNSRNRGPDWHDDFIMWLRSSEIQEIEHARSPTRGCRELDRRGARGAASIAESHRGHDRDNASRGVMVLMFESFTAGAERALERADRLARRRERSAGRAAGSAGRTDDRDGESGRGAAGGIRRGGLATLGRAEARSHGDVPAEVEEAELAVKPPSSTDLLGPLPLSPCLAAGLERGDEPGAGVRPHIARWAPSTCWPAYLRLRPRRGRAARGRPGDSAVPQNA